MATYVFSDVHGHAKTLRRMIERVSPSEDDAIIMLGDMIDRGPDPMDVVDACRELHNCTVLMGNHEDLMLGYLKGKGDPIEHYLDLYNWKINGGDTTRKGLKSLKRASIDDYNELIDWFESLPLWTHAWVGDRLYLFVHAGIDPRFVGELPDEWTPEAIDELMLRQSVKKGVEELMEIRSELSSYELLHCGLDELVWIRENFWRHHTGLINEKGEGPIIISGHTPTPYLPLIADVSESDLCDTNGLFHIGKLGADETTGGVADRWDIDCGCAGGHGFGQLLMMRLDDGEEFYEAVREGE